MLLNDQSRKQDRGHEVGFYRVSQRRKCVIFLDKLHADLHGLAYVSTRRAYIWLRAHRKLPKKSFLDAIAMTNDKIVAVWPDRTWNLNRSNRHHISDRAPANTLNQIIIEKTMRMIIRRGFIGLKRGARIGLKRGVEGIIGLYQGVETSILYKRKMANVLAGLPDKKPFVFRQRLFHAYGDTRWHQAYASANGIVSDNYVPEDLFFVNIETKLNPRMRTRFYTDKNAIDRLRFPCTFPKTLGRIIRGEFLLADYQPGHPDAALGGFPAVVVKPSLSTGGGKNVAFMTGAEAAAFASEVRANRPRDEYIFQEPIRQAASLAAFSPDSVNTLRVLTMRVEGAPQVISSVLRMGRDGSRIDNQEGGGISCGIKNGRLIANAYDKNFTSYQRHPNTNLRFDDFKVPAYYRAVDLSLNLHALIPEIGLVSWDIAIDENENPVVIEMNMQEQEINFHQLAHGPLFRGRIVSILLKTKPLVLFDYPVY